MQILNSTQKPNWLIIDARTGRTVELPSALDRKAARRRGSRLLTEQAPGTDLDVLSREVVVMRAG